MYVCSYFCKALFGVQCTSFEFVNGKKNVMCGLNIHMCLLRHCLCFLLCITNPQSKWWRVGLFIKIYANCTLYFTLWHYKESRVHVCV